MLRVLSELLWALRRRGIEISASEALDAARAARTLGFADRNVLQAALATTVIKKQSDREVYDLVFDEFFAPHAAHPSDLMGRLRAQGFAENELSALADLLRALATRDAGGDFSLLSAMSKGDAEVSTLLRAAGIRRRLASAQGSSAVGYHAEQIARELGIGRSNSVLGRLELALSDAVGQERASALRLALASELMLLRRRVRQLIVARLARDEGQRPHVERLNALDRPFDGLDPADSIKVERALRLLSQRLSASHGLRMRRYRGGHVDARRTLRLAMRSFGVPMRLARRQRRRDRPRLVVVCDVSESVRHASRFMLQFVASAQSLFASTRSFVFISDLVETTELLSRRSVDQAVQTLQSGQLLPVSQNSNYGQALTSLESRLRGRIDRRTTVVLLGDGRSNLRHDGADALRRLRHQCRGVLLLCPEDRATWGQGDSAMLRLAAASTEVIMVRSGRELEAAALRLTRFR